MSDDVRDEFNRSYPAERIAVPPAGDLWARGRQQRRRRTALQAVGAAASVVVLAGVGAVYGLPEATTTSNPAPQIGSDGTGDEAPDGQPTGEADDPEPLETEPECDYPDGSYAQELCEDLEEHSPIPEPTEAERERAAKQQRANEAMHAEHNQGQRMPPDGWTAEPVPVDISGLENRNGEGAWYIAHDTATGLADRAAFDDRIGAETMTELCDWVDQEQARADEAAGEPVSSQTVTQMVHGASGVQSGDGLSLAIAAACDE